MANICTNVITLHGDPDKIKTTFMRLKLSCATPGQDNELFDFEHYVPIVAWEYDNALATWGTKLRPDTPVFSYRPRCVKIDFGTAWSPSNLHVFQRICEEHEVKTAEYYYFEPGNEIYGFYKFRNGQYSAMSSREGESSRLRRQVLRGMKSF